MLDIVDRTSVVQIATKEACPFSYRGKYTPYTVRLQVTVE